MDRVDLTIPQVAFLFNFYVCQWTRRQNSGQLLPPMSDQCHRNLL